MVAQGGLSQSEVDVQYLAPPNIVKALAGKAIGGGILAEPWVARAEVEGGAVSDRLRPLQWEIPP